MKTNRLLTVVSLVALGLGATSRPCRAQTLPVGVPGIGLGGPSSSVADRLVWRASEPLGLDTAPLTTLRLTRRVAVESEWAPLYRGRDGTRLEQSRQTLRVGIPAGGALLGAEVSRETGVLKGGETRWGADAGGEPLRFGAVGMAFLGRRLEGAASVSALADGSAGVAFELAAPVGPTWSARVSGANLPREGTLGVRWDDRLVDARGGWTEKRLRASVAGPAKGVGLSATLESFDLVPRAGGAAGDDLEPHLSWRAARALVSHTDRRLRVSAEIRHGEGRQRLDVYRGGKTYATATGPVRDDAILGRLAPARTRWDAIGWTGRCQGSLNGSLSLWPFEEAAVLSGTRYAARSDFSLRHWGVGIDGRPSRRNGFDAGAALWGVTPEGSYESWRATWFGLGRDDYQSNPLRQGPALLAGLRLARTQAWDALTLRLELVQWVPIRSERSSSPAGSGASTGGSSGGGSAPSSRSGGDWGGTVIRLSVGGL